LELADAADLVSALKEFSTATSVFVHRADFQMRSGRSAAIEYKDERYVLTEVEAS
jgi:hypothetical protein